MTGAQIQELSYFLSRELCRDYYIAHDFSIEDRCPDGQVKIVLEEAIRKFISINNK